MCQRVAKAKAPREWRSVLGENATRRRPGTTSSPTAGSRTSSGCSATNRPGWFASWPAELESALGEVVRKLRREVGPAPAYWAWGHLRQLRLEHPLFGKHRRLGAAFNLGPVPCGGDCNTVSQAGARPG